MKRLWLWVLNGKIYYDIIGFSGLGIMGYGLWLYRPDIAFTAVGIGLVILAALGARR